MECNQFIPFCGVQLIGHRLTQHKNQFKKQMKHDCAVKSGIESQMVL